MKTTLIKSVIFLALLLAATLAVGKDKRLAPELNDKISNLASGVGQQDPGEMVDVIIQFSKDKPLSSYLERMLGLGVQARNSFSIVNGGLFQVPVSLIPVLLQDPGVVYISPDRPIKHSSQWDFVLDASQVSPLIEDGFSGSGIGVAVIDSGVAASHPDLQNSRTGSSRVVYSQSFIAGLDASDQYGHGTHVAGLVAGNGSAGNGFMYGVAINANIINLRVLDANGAGTDSNVIAAIQRAIQLKSTYNIRVINLSLGRQVSESYTLDPVCQAVEQAWKAGISVVVAAGNYGQDNSLSTNGYATITAPGNDPYVITVGATNTHYTDTTSDDTVTTYSSKGPTLLDHVIKPDLVAPGNRVVSLLANGSTLDVGYPANEVPPGAYGGGGSRSSYFVLSGTSMATPIVSGTIALMLQRSPSLTPDQIKIRLMKTASKSYPAYTGGTANSGTYYSLQDDIFTVGAGYLNAYGAVASNDQPSGTGLSPIAVLDSSGNVDLEPDPSSAFANSITWGTSIVWGNNVLQSNSIVWGSSIVWGNSTDVGFSIVWGQSIVWGTGLVPFSESGDSDNN